MEKEATYRQIKHPLVLASEQTTLAMPEQHEGVLHDGRQFYFRYRQGWATLGLGDTIDDAVGDPVEVGIGVGHRYQGSFRTDSQRQTVFALLLERRLTAEEEAS